MNVVCVGGGGGGEEEEEEGRGRSGVEWSGVWRPRRSSQTRTQPQQSSTQRCQRRAPPSSDHTNHALVKEVLRRARKLLSTMLHCLRLMYVCLDAKSCLEMPSRTLSQRLTHQSRQENPRPPSKSIAVVAFARTMTITPFLQLGGVHHSEALLATCGNTSRHVGTPSSPQAVPLAVPRRAPVCSEGKDVWHLPKRQRHGRPLIPSNTRGPHLGRESHLVSQTRRRRTPPSSWPPHSRRYPHICCGKDLWASLRAD